MKEVIGKKQFEEVLASHSVAFVDFYATWCGPCRMLSPTIEKLATEFGNIAAIAKVDVDKNSEVAAEFGIQTIPTIIIFKDGKPVDKIVGMRSFDEFAKAIKSHI